MPGRVHERRSSRGGRRDPEPAAKQVSTSSTPRAPSSPTPATSRPTRRAGSRSRRPCATTRASPDVIVTGVLTRIEIWDAARLARPQGRRPGRRSGRLAAASGSDARRKHDRTGGRQPEQEMTRHCADLTPAPRIGAVKPPLRPLPPSRFGETTERHSLVRGAGAGPSGRSGGRPRTRDGRLPAPTGDGPGGARAPRTGPARDRRRRDGRGWRACPPPPRRPTGPRAPRHRPRRGGGGGGPGASRPVR